MDTLLDTLRTTSRSLRASPRGPETGNYRGPVVQVNEPHDPQTRDPEFDSRSGCSFAEIVMNRNSKKTKKFLHKVVLNRNKLVLVLKTTPTPKKLH